MEKLAFVRKMGQRKSPSASTSMERTRRRSKGRTSRAQRWRGNSHVIEEGGPKSWWKSSRWERDDDAQSSQDRC